MEDYEKIIYTLELVSENQESVSADSTTLLAQQCLPIAKENEKKECMVNVMDFMEEDKLVITQAISDDEAQTIAMTPQDEL
eukprot:11493514-Ditylum_brightwellii.AAC.1